ncbi:MAG TPA: ATP-binding protein [Myxococcales bacterium]|nr:ATP-binding protein [Myxococcales bacterium]
MIGLELQRFLEVLPVPAMVMIGRRVISANRRMGALLGVTPEELLATADPVLRFVSPDDQPQVLGRIAARARGEPVAEEMDQAVIAANGQRIPVRAHVTPFAAVDPNAIMLVMTYERLRERHAELVRGFVDVAVAAQRERTQAGILRVAREQLQRLGLSVTLCELGAGRFRILEAGAGNPFISTLQRTWPGWIPDSVFPMARASTEGMLIEDLPGVMAKALGRPREEFIAAPPLAMVASIPIDGVAGYLFSCSGNDLDRTVASAFGLLGKQLGGALEMVGRLEELDRRNTELRIQAEEVALLNDVAHRLAGSFEVRPLLELGGETLRRLLDADQWCMLLPDPREPALRFHAGFPDQVALGQQDEAVAMSAFRERRVVQVLDPPLGAEGPSSARTRLAVPLIARNEVLGVALLLDEHARSFTRAEMDRAQAVAGQLALALLSARLYEALRSSYAELERAQRDLIDRERLAALGELSASIAHEVRNPLGVIFNSVGSLQRLLKPQGDVALLLDIVGEEADRLNRMVGDLLDYSRPVQPSLQPVPLRPLFEEALAAASQQAGPGAEHVSATVRVADDAATVRADARLLRQALVNLFLNAYQAMPRSGRLDVRSSRALADGRPCAEIVVQDSGPGIPAEIVDKVFQPFFTTKATGTGLGLAVVRRIVEGHGGTIELAQARAGAEFRLRLPLEA